MGEGPQTTQSVLEVASRPIAQTIARYRAGDGPEANGPELQCASGDHGPDAQHHDHARYDQSNHGHISSIYQGIDTSGSHFLAADTKKFNGVSLLVYRVDEQG